MTYPKSFLKLLLIGFALVLLPLLLAFINANNTFGKLTRQSLSNMTQAVETTRASRTLLEELSVMERSTRQYFVLRDNVILTNYSKAHARFSDAINSLTKQAISLQQPELISLMQQEQSLYIAISNANQQMIFDAGVANAFAVLSNQAYKINNINNNLIIKQADFLQQKITSTQRQLFWQTLTLIPLAVVIAGLITWLIARPIRHMDNAISQLGRGDYEHKIIINGPDDLKKVGARLDWLRVELKDLHQQKQFFLQQASHALKTPLTSIREASELLNDGTAGKLNAQQTEITHILRESSLRLQSMIENLLKFTESQFNTSQYIDNNSHKQVNIAQLFNEILNTYQLSIDQKNITINQQLNNLIIDVEAEKIHTLLDNLVSNAVKFTLNNGNITLRANQTNNNCIIDIIDTGIGIKDANKQHLFDAFYRGEQPENSLIEGSGLGLFIAKQAAATINADITLAPSEHGAHFIVRIPTKTSLN